MKHERGQGLVYQPKYRDQAGELKTIPTFWIQFNVRGKRHRESAGTESRIAAVRFLKKRMAEAQPGRPFGREVEKTTLGELVAMVTADYQVNGRKLRAVKAPLAHLVEHFGADALAMDVTTDRITAYAAVRQKDGAANATINRSLSALKRAFALAERAGRVARRPYIALLEERNRRKGFFEADQLAALLKELPEYLAPLIEAAAITGWRIASELTTRQRRHLDLDAGWLRLDPQESKNGEGRNFPLTPRLREVLSAQVERTRTLEVETGQVVPWLFHRAGKPIGSFRKTWIAACKRAGLAGRIPHDFRRSAVRSLERAGISRSAAMAMVGHKTQSIYSRYAIADEATLKEAAVKLAALEAATTTTGRVIALEKSQSKAKVKTVP